jgi:A118 family predicted phage portal protein
MLPEADTAWPPEAMRPIYSEITKLAQWYGDDTDSLYPAGLAAQGGWGGFLSFITSRGGKTATTAPSIGAMHMPVAADVARTSADLLFAELPKLEVQDRDGKIVPASQDRLDEMAERMSLGSQLVEAAELCAALTGIFWRVTFDPTVIRDRPILSWVQPDAAVPEWAWGELRAVTFWQALPQPANGPKGVWRHLERHSTVVDAVGRVTAIVEHGLYVGEDEKLGRRMSLTDHPATAGITVLDQDTIVLPPGVPMTAGYVPNIRPNRKMRGTPYGRADISGMEKPGGPLAGIDKAWSSWMRDLDLGKGRVFVAAQLLRDLGDGAGAAFDIDQAIYSPLEAPVNVDSGLPITLSQFAIRVDEHSRTIGDLFASVVRGAGYSLGSFGVADSGVPATATEVKAKLALSMQTREKKTRYWGPQVSQLQECLLALDAAIFSGPGLPDGARVAVEFSDTVAEDPHRMAETVNQLAQAQAASTWVKVEMIHPDWDEAQIKEEVARIQADQQIAMPSPLMDSESMDGTGGMDATGDATDPFGADQS